MYCLKLVKLPPCCSAHSVVHKSCFIIKIPTTFNALTHARTHTYTWHECHRDARVPVHKGTTISVNKDYSGSTHTCLVFFWTFQCPPDFLTYIKFV